MTLKNRIAISNAPTHSLKMLTSQDVIMQQEFHDHHFNMFLLQYIGKKEKNRFKFLSILPIHNAFLFLFLYNIHNIVFYFFFVSSWK